MSKRMIALLTVLSVLFAVGLTGGTFAASLYRRYEYLQEIEALDINMKRLEDSVTARSVRVCQWYNYCLNTGYSPDNFGDAYGKILNMGNGIMGWVEMPSLGLRYPVYHGNSQMDSVSAVEHVVGSALPIGGKGNHSVFFAPEAAQSLTEGDLILLHILNETLVYEVNRVSTVSPGYAGGLASRPDEDLCTFVIGITQGIQTRKRIACAVRAAPEQERMAMEGSVDCHRLDVKLLNRMTAAGMGALLLPVLTGCIGRVTGWVVRKAYCDRLTKKKRTIA